MADCVTYTVTLTSIERDAIGKTDFDEIVNEFGSRKAWKVSL